MLDKKIKNLTKKEGKKKNKTNMFVCETKRR